MPARTPSACRESGCPGKSTAKHGYCSQHTSKSSNWSKWQSTKGSTTQRGYGHTWRKIRAAILRRDNYLCQECLRNGDTVEARQVDHKTPKSQGGTDDPANLESICDDCHEHKTATE